jgi:2-keto-4-pentenoate hydratase/2-oxohepta-3-ene-1,7-dioic acid hydratase in catechol pathway
VRVLPPVVPSKFILASLNYQEVVTQLGYPRPKSPILSLKAPSALVADGGDIHYAAASKYVTFAPDLAVVIGWRCRRVPRERAIDQVLGYTLTNDVSARDIQEAEVQYTRCKSFNHLHGRLRRGGDARGRHRHHRGRARGAPDEPRRALVTRRPCPW